MRNTINVNRMTRSFHNYARCMETGNKNDTRNAFLESMVGKSAAKAAAAAIVTGNVTTQAVSTQDMTMDEYKRYVYDRISRIPMNPSRAWDNISIHISEDGFEAMKNDPEYEKWVLDRLEQEFMSYDPWAAMCGGSYAVKYIGASPEEYRGDSWYTGYQNGKQESLYEQKSEDSFWEQRAKREERLQEQYEEFLEKKVLAERLQEQQLNAKLAEMKAEGADLSELSNAASKIPQIVTAYDISMLLMDL